MPNSFLSIKNLADDIALTVRRAQGFAIGVRGYSTDFSQGYGIHFTSNTGSDIYAGSNKAFILFADISNYNQYDNSSATCGEPSAGDECLELLSITSMDKITEIYASELRRSIERDKYIQKKEQDISEFKVRIKRQEKAIKDQSKIINQLKERIASTIEGRIINLKRKVFN